MPTDSANPTCCDGQADEQQYRSHDGPPDPRVGPARNRVVVLEVLDDTLNALDKAALLLGLGAGGGAYSVLL